MKGRIIKILAVLPLFMAHLAFGQGGQSIEDIANSIQRKEREAAIEIPNQKFTVSPDMIPRPPDSSNIIGHYRGKEGQEFSAPKHIELDLETDDDSLSTGVALGGDDPLKLSEIRDCIAPKTTSKQLDLSREEAEGFKADLLFIRTEKVPLDPYAAFGNDIELRPFSVKDPFISAYSAKMMNIPCLPFRIRTRDGVQYFHEGEPALRNYDVNRNGESVKSGG